MDKPWLEFSEVDEIPPEVSNRPGRKTPWGEVYDWGIQAAPGAKMKLVLRDKKMFHSAYLAIGRWNFRNRDNFKIKVTRDIKTLTLYLEKVQPKSL